MATAEKGKVVPRTRTKPATVEPVRVGKRQGWRVSFDGTYKTVVTSKSSAAAIEEATVIYGDALKRLADR